MGFKGIITPLDGGSPSDLTFHHAEIHQNIVPAINSIGAWVWSYGHEKQDFVVAIMSRDVNAVLPPVAGPIATLYYSFDPIAVNGHSYEMSLDQTWVKWPLENWHSKSFVSVGDSSYYTFVPSVVFAGDEIVFTIATATFTSDTVTFVPEPGTMLLLGIGIAGLAGLRRRR